MQNFIRVNERAMRMVDDDRVGSPVLPGHRRSQWHDTECWINTVSIAMVREAVTRQSQEDGINTAILLMDTSSQDGPHCVFVGETVAQVMDKLREATTPPMYKLDNDGSISRFVPKPLDDQENGAADVDKYPDDPHVLGTCPSCGRGLREAADVGQCLVPSFHKLQPMQEDTQAHAEAVEAEATNNQIREHPKYEALVSSKMISNRRSLANNIAEDLGLVGLDGIDRVTTLAHRDRAGQG